MTERMRAQRTCRPFQTVVRVASAMLLLSFPSAAQFIDFEDGAGANNLPIANHYPGFTFMNAVWISPGPQFHNGMFGLGVDEGVNPTNDWAFPGTTSPIVILIDSPTNSVSITAFDIGVNGAKVAAFDDLDQELDQAIAVGSSSQAIDVRLLVTGEAIAKVELSQPFYGSSGNPNDGVGWDDLLLGEYIFGDGLESGDVDAWSAALP